MRSRDPWPDPERPVEFHEVKCWREGWWYLLSVRGKTVWGRHTRDETYETAWLVFSGSQSPDLEKTWAHKHGLNSSRFVILRGPHHLLRRSRQHYLRNRIEVPITAAVPF